MGGDSKVLTGFIERRTVETAFSELALTTDAEQLAERAEQIAQHGASALAVLLSLLETRDPQLRGGLGQVALRLPREQVIAGLRAVARSPERGDQARLTALTILDRFLKVPIDQDLLTGLQDPTAVAEQSLRELEHEMAKNPLAIIEYLAQLAEQPPDVASMILEAIPSENTSAHLLTLLRMFAQGEDATLAQRALDRLGAMRTPEAVSCLDVLSASLPPTMATVASRSMRKLRMRGVPIPEAQPSAGWRALLSPVDGTGSQVIWFVRVHPDDTRGALISILTKDPLGIMSCFGSTEVPVVELPAPQPLGSIFRLARKHEDAAIMLLEVPFDVGRQAIRDAQELNWACGVKPPLEYRFFSSLIWTVAPDDGMLPEDNDLHEIPDASSGAALLDHPIFADWYWRSPELTETAQRLGAELNSVARSAQITALASAQFDAPVLAGYQRALRAMARWLRLAGQSEIARLASATAATLTLHAAPEIPFIRRLIGTGLDVAIANRREQTGESPS